MNHHTSFNIDQNEMQHFSSLAHIWWNKQGPMRTLHDINPIRLEYIRSIIGEFSGKRILDIGCGGGILSEGMAQEGACVTGLDSNAALIEAATDHAKTSGVTIDYQAIPLEQFHHDELFDVITCLELLEHVPDPLALIQQCRKYIKPQGKIILSTINRHPKAFLFAILGAEYILGLIPKGTHHYDKFIRPAELADMLSLAGFKPTDLRGLHYQPWTHQASFTKDVRINYFLSATAL